jgi:uncharacterized protein (DUF2236 family)
LRARGLREAEDSEKRAREDQNWFNADLSQKLHRICLEQSLRSVARHLRSMPWSFSTRFGTCHSWQRRRLPLQRMLVQATGGLLPPWARELSELEKGHRLRRALGPLVRATVALSGQGFCASTPFGSSPAGVFTLTARRDGFEDPSRRVSSWNK